MDFQKLFLSAEGRIGRSEFWAGWCILFVVNFVLHFLPIIGWVLGLLLIYPWVCVYTKRLHDMGRSGWLQVIPMVVVFVAIIVAAMAGFGAVIGSMASANSDSGAAMAALGGASVILLAMAIAFVVGIGFLLWVGISPTQAGPNQYGPEPGETAPAAPPSAPPPPTVA
jgi:uncharacterized membrane protein YhaH (DUF805 family)